MKIDLGKWTLSSGGRYDNTATYDQLTMVYYNGSTYVTLKEITGIEPSDDGVNWRLLAKGFDATKLEDTTVIDTQGMIGKENTEVSGQALIDVIADKVMNQLVTKTLISQTQVDNIDMIPSSALINDMNEVITANTNAITKLNSDLQWNIYDSPSKIGVTSAQATLDLIKDAIKDHTKIEFYAWKDTFTNFEFGGTGSRHIITATRTLSGGLEITDYDVDNNVLYINGHNGTAWSGWKEVATTNNVFSTAPIKINGTEVDARTLNPGNYQVIGFSIDKNWPLDDTTNAYGSLMVLGNVNTSLNKGYRAYLLMTNKTYIYFGTEWWGNEWKWYDIFNNCRPTSSGNFYIKDGYGVLYASENEFQVETKTAIGDSTNKRMLNLRNGNYKTLKDALIVQDVVDGALTGYAIHGAHNKPSGTYTGDGIDRTIDVGGIGKLIMVDSTNIGVCYVNPYGYIRHKGATIDSVNSTDCSFGSSGLKLSASSLLNQSGITYKYQVL